jgi:hypothetical protein
MPPTDLIIAHAPRIAPALFVSILTERRSPAAGEAATCYRIAEAAGVDPAVALAFFAHESSYGTAGRAIANKSWGNLRKSQGRALGVSDGFARYATWAESLDDWCHLLTGPVYAGCGLHTVAQIVPKYAPTSDGNAPLAYIASVTALVLAWQARAEASGWKPAGGADPWAAWGAAFPLPPEQQGYAIPQAWRARQSDLGAATSAELPVEGGYALRQFTGGYIVWSRRDTLAHVHVWGRS